MNKSSFKKITKNRDNLVVAVTGLVKDKGANTRFEWFNSVSNLKCADSFFITDPNWHFYLNGIPEVGKNVEQTVEFFQRQIKGYDKVIFVGTCGISSITALYGSLLNVHAVLSYMTVVDLEIPYKAGWKKYLDKVKRVNNEAYEKYKDVRPFLNTTTQYYCQKAPWEDHLHSEEHFNLIKHLPNVHKIQGPSIKELIDRGLFEDLIQKMFSDSPHHEFTTQHDQSD